jgi:hypothetical protein
VALRTREQSAKQIASIRWHNFQVSPDLTALVTYFLAATNGPHRPRGAAAIAAVLHGRVSADMALKSS